MGEIKSVKVDNWGVFFLQKLQNFFNKTDYCDLTLQFRDNSQLKVHRLVLSACTDYFNVLEQTCEVVDDAIIMPNGLQADVVVPIVNFMYTGTLEFELKMYNRLLRTAKDMNMTVLLKLLEAHRRTMEMHPQKSSGQSSPKPRRRTTAPAAAANLPSNTVGRSLIQTNQGKRFVVGSNVNALPNRNVATTNTITRMPATGPIPVRQIGSTTFTRIKVENEQQETHMPTSTSGGYTLIKQSPQSQQPTSPFEQLRKGYNNNKRPAVSTFVSPPAKKPNLEDVKEFAEQQRMRKQIAAEYGDDDYDASNIMDDDTIHNDDDDDDMMTSSGPTQASQTLSTSTSAGVQTVASSSSQQQQSEDPPGTTTIIVKHESPTKPPTIIVKDNSNSKMNHAKIISEVLRQYPHLVKGNKNIKLKIMPNAGGQAQKIIVKKEPMDTENQMQLQVKKLSNTTNLPESQQQHQSMKTLASNIVANRPTNVQQKQTEISPSSKMNSCGTQATLSKSSVTSGSSTQNSAAQPQKRRIDSKTMHALIALGAENTTGPWLCLRCGRNGHPISIPSYRGFRRHLINTHKETIDPALCEHCGWRSVSKRELHFHIQLEHKIKTNLYIFPECQLCQQMCIDSDGLNQHLIDSHPDENKQQCIYCNKIFPEEIQLYTHMKTFHKKQALEDGIIDYSDDENQSQMSLPPLPPVEYGKENERNLKEPQQAKKIKILSDISLPIASSIIKTDSVVHQQELSTSSATEEYLQDQEHDQDNTDTKFVAADGSEVILTAEQRKEILSQLNQDHEGSGVVMVLNKNQESQQRGDTQSDDAPISHDETSQTTTVTNEERDEDEEEQIGEEEDDQHHNNAIKSLQPNLEDDSTDQTEAAVEATNEETSVQEEEADHELGDIVAGAEHERTEHLEESKESIDNLEWAENLISEHDLADEASSQTINENSHIHKLEEKEIRDDDDNKSQDEISKKLKELTGDWSEDDDDDMPEDDPLSEISQFKEVSKEKEDPSGAADDEMTEGEKEKDNGHEKQVENPGFEDHAELLASLQSHDKDEIDKHKENIALSAEAENIDEDDIDMALKSLHRDDIEDETPSTAEDEEKIYENKKKENKNLIDHTEERVHKEVEQPAKSQDEEENFVSVKEKNVEADEKIQEEKNLKELEAIAEREASSSTTEVDEETKKGLIDSILNEQVETMKNTATETLKTEESIKKDLDTSLDDKQNKVESDSKVTDESNMDETNVVVPKAEEFLDVTPTKEEDLDDNVCTIATAAELTEATEGDDASTATAKEKTPLSSEERVKSLISEWGDDDEDEDDNDADLPSNL